MEGRAISHVFVFLEMFLHKKSMESSGYMGAVQSTDICGVLETHGLRSTSSIYSQAQKCLGHSEPELEASMN